MKIFKFMIVAAVFMLGSFGLQGFSAEMETGKPLVIDVRTEAEWNDGHLEGAILIPFDKIGEAIAKVAPDRKIPISLYCRTGRRSGIALDTLKKIGYENVTNYGSVQDASEKLHIPVVK